MREPTCIHCGSPMEPVVVRAKGYNAELTSVALFLGGIIIFFAIPILGWVIGPLMVVGSMLVKRKRENLLRCVGCGYAVPRV